VKRWPKVDPDVRRRLMREVKRRHNVEAGRRSPAQRLARLDEIVALARELAPRARLPRTRSDEDVGLWLRMKARFREAGEH